MIVVTGGAGFIGANLLQRLNSEGLDDILVVDDLSRGEKFRNLADARISDYVDKDDFFDLLDSGSCPDLEFVFHQGACSNTMERDGRAMMRNNFTYSKVLLQHCQARRVPFVYASSASVYGAGPGFSERPGDEHPLNVYAYSKFLFDCYVRSRLAGLESPVVGLRYFNVYGPREGHKGQMASAALHFFEEYRERGYIELFEGSEGYADGEQRRDFVYVEDVAAVNLYFYRQRETSGIFNVGAGRAVTYNELGAAVVNAIERRSASVRELVAQGMIRYKPFPAALRGKYQCRTQADVGALRSAGYEQEFTELTTGVARYVDWLSA